MSNPKLAELKKVVDTYNKSYEKKGGHENHRVGGKKVAIFFGSEMENQVVKLGIPRYDDVCGGLPIGKFTIDYGPSGAGKSTWNYFVIARLQSMGKLCAVVNAEGGFDPTWAAKCGVNVDELLIVDAGDTFEETAQIMYDLMKHNLVDHWLFDSIHGQLTEKEAFKSSGNNQRGAERGVGDTTVGALPQKIGALLKRLNPVFGKSKASLTIIGQARDSIDAYAGGLTLTGGHALRHFARRICRWTRAAKSTWAQEKIEGKEVFVGFTTRVTVELQQLNDHEGEFILIPFHKDLGVDSIRLFVDDARNVGIVRTTGASRFEIDDAKGEVVKLHGATNLYAHYREHTEDFAHLKEQLLSSPTLTPNAHTQEDEDEAEDSE